MTEYCYLNGKIIPLKDATISVLDIGVLRGYGVFDFTRTYNGRPQALEAHIKRLGRSAKRLGLRVPLKEAEIKAVIDKLLQKNGFKEAMIRMVLTGGKTLQGIDFDPRQPTFFILAQKLEAPSADMYREGVNVITVEHQRLLPEAKTNNYITAVMNQRRLKKAKAFEMLYYHNGKVLELSTSNIFIVKRGVIVTPATGILMGTTRGIAIALAKKSYPLVEREVRLRELLAADEAFLTAANKGILPVTRVEGKNIKTGKVGPVTRHLMAEYEKSIH